MGRRAKKAPVQTKKRVVLAKRFKCPFCANEDVVECEMKHREGTGSLKCRICDASFQMPIHHLHEPIDVFSEWLDECEAAEKRNNGIPDGNSGGGGGGGGSMGESNAALYDSEEEDDLGEGSGLAGKDQSKKQHSLNSLGVGDSDDDSD
jgi:transcription elongation factor Elf1